MMDIVINYFDSDHVHVFIFGLPDWSSQVLPFVWVTPGDGQIFVFGLRFSNFKNDLKKKNTTLSRQKDGETWNGAISI